jgi:cell division inhibitor SepF
VVHGNAHARLGPDEPDDDADGDVGEFQDYDETLMGDGFQIAIVRPRNFQDAVIIGEYYREDIPVIINLEGMDTPEATRIIDFASGLILGLRGDIERISRRAFLIVPPGAAILTGHEGPAQGGFFNQA